MVGPGQGHNTAGRSPKRAKFTTSRPAGQESAGVLAATLPFRGRTLLIYNPRAAEAFSRFEAAQCAHPSIRFTCGFCRYRCILRTSALGITNTIEKGTDA